MSKALWDNGEWKGPRWIPGVPAYQQAFSVGQVKARQVLKSGDLPIQVLLSGHQYYVLEHEFVAYVEQAATETTTTTVR